MKQQREVRSGFSLMEVNMAVFVLAIGILSMAVLYPLGLRESIQSQADMKQSMFADYMLNMAVAAACGKDVKWSEWNTWAASYNMVGKGPNDELVVGSNMESVPPFMKNALQKALTDYNATQAAISGKNYRRELGKSCVVYCILVPGYSDRLMGIFVRSLDMDVTDMSQEEQIRRLEAQPVYYAEARFQGLGEK